MLVRSPLKSHIQVTSSTSFDEYPTAGFIMCRVPCAGHGGAGRGVRLHVPLRGEEARGVQLAALPQQLPLAHRLQLHAGRRSQRAGHRRL